MVLYFECFKLTLLCTFNDYILIVNTLLTALKLALISILLIIFIIRVDCTLNLENTMYL